MKYGLRLIALALLVSLTGIAFASNDAKTDILVKAGFEEQKGVKILKIKGTPYEMGYQHGYLLADKIQLMVNKTLKATAAYVAAQTGTDIKRAKELLWLGQREAEPYLCTIMALYPDFSYKAEEPLEAFKAHIANMREIRGQGQSN